MKKSEKKSGKQYEEKLESVPLRKGNPKSSVKDLYSVILKSTLNEFSDKKEIPPRVIISIKDKGEKDKLMVAPLDECSNFQERAALLGLIARNTASRKMNVEAVIAVSEVWFTVVKADDYDDDKHVMPSQDPDRKEAVMVVAEDSSGNLIHNAYEIIRKGDDVNLVLLKNDFPNAGKWQKKSEEVSNYLLDTFWSIYKDDCIKQK